MQVFAFELVATSIAPSLFGQRPTLSERLEILTEAIVTIDDRSEIDRCRRVVR